jgi:YD repeat-containing protein
MSSELAGECRHFLCYSGVTLPLKLMTPLEPEQIANRYIYFRGYYDEQDRLTGIQKIVYAETEFEHRYHYDDSGKLRQAEITDAEGEVTVLHLDETGAVRPD